MNMQETKAILAFVQAAYPKFVDGRPIESTISLWAKMFADDDIRAVQAGLEAFIASDEKGFAPTIGQIKKLMPKVKGLSETEAWAKVSKALHNGIYGYEEEFAKLPKEIQKTIGDPKMLRHWALMDENEVQTVIASNFQRSFRGTMERENRLSMLPSGARNEFERLNSDFTLLLEGG